MNTTNTAPTTMLERVAHAILTASLADGSYEHMKPDDVLRYARAAILAMREPSEELLCAGVIAVQAADDGAGEPWDYVRETWQAMIDAALAEQG